MISRVNIQAIYKLALNSEKAEGNTIAFIYPNLIFSDNDIPEEFARAFKGMSHAFFQPRHGNIHCFIPKFGNGFKIFFTIQSDHGKIPLLTIQAWSSKIKRPI